MGRVGEGESITMAKIDFLQLDRELKANTIRDVYVVVGAEAYLVQSAIKNIEQKILGNNSNEFSRTVIDDKGFSSGSFKDMLSSVPMFGQKNIILVRDADKINKTKLEDILPILGTNKNSPFVIFSATKLDGRGKFLQTLNKKDFACVVECKSLYSNQIPSWINMEVHRLEKQIAHDAAAYLSDVVGSDLGQLMQSIERVILYIGNKQIIDLADIEEAVAETTQRSVFELTDAIGLNNKKKAISILANLVDYGTSPIMILNMIARHYRILIRAKEVEKLGSRPEVASYLGVNPYFVKNYMAQAKNYSLEQLKHKFSDLSECDRELKSSRVPNRIILEKLILS